MSEDERYKDIQDQVAQLLDRAAEEDTAGIVGLGCVWLAAALFVPNEQAHARAKEQRHDGD